MPIYCYEFPNGRVIERAFSAGKAPSVVREGNEVAKRSFQAERASAPATKGWPIECYASGVHPSQAGELRDHLAKRGVPTEVTRNGDPIYRDAAHRRKALKARGIVDRSSFV